jgi:hypothetical protein
MKTYKVVEYRAIKSAPEKFQPEFQKKEYKIVKEKLSWKEAKELRATSRYYLIVPG